MDKLMIAKVWAMYEPSLNDEHEHFSCSRCQEELGSHDCDGCPVYCWGHSE